MNHALWSPSASRRPYKLSDDSFVNPWTWHCNNAVFTTAATRLRGTHREKTIRSIALPWASERFFQEGGNSGFFQRQPKRFFHGGPKLVKFHFTHSKPRKKLFLLKFNRKRSKFQNPGGLQVSSSAAHALCITQSDTQRTFLRCMSS